MNRNPSHTLIRGAAIALLTAALAACNSTASLGSNLGGNPGQNTGGQNGGQNNGGTSGGQNGSTGGQTGGTVSISKYGVISLSRTDMDGESIIAGSGSFYALGQALTSVPANPYAVNSGDFCYVSDGGQQGDPAGNALGTVTSLDAGAKLSLKAAGQAYATLDRMTANNSFIYLSTTLPDAAGATSLTVDVPGATNGFPAFAGVTVPALPAASFTLKANGQDVTAGTSITADTSFTWTNPTNAAGTFLSVFGSNAATPAVSFFCITADDGSFSFPQATKAELAAKNFGAGKVQGATRSAYRTETKGDAVLYVSNSQIRHYE